MIQKFRSFYTQSIYIEFGSEVFKAYIPGVEYSHSLPSVIVVSNDYESVLAVGEKAAKRYGKGKNSSVVRPVKRGSISDYTAAELFVKVVIEDLLKHTGFFTRTLGPEVVLGVHSLSTEVELSALMDTFQSIGASKVKMVNEGIASHYQSKLESRPESLICKIGAEITDLFIISDHEVVLDASFYFGTNTIVSAIKTSIKSKYGIDPSVKDIKEILSSIDLGTKRKSNVIFRGKSIETGQPVREELSAIEIMQTILSQVDKIIDVIKDMMKKSESEILSSIVENGISLSGGATHIKGLSDYMSKELKIDLQVNTDMFSSVQGLHWINSNPDLFESYEVNDLIFL
jgi:rod shape-determining protein MreB